VVYYNEWDAYPATWLRNLVAVGQLPAGEVDETDIREVKGGDLERYDQCHFFAGIGGWPLALRLAGWPDGRPVWTGSCPCQPFSAAGNGLAERDERHLWPAFRRLIAECRPPTVFGEQVASASGRQWLSGVRADLEALGYEVGAADLCAPCVGAPHRRQRLFWVAVTDSGRREGQDLPVRQPRQEQAAALERRACGRLADAEGARRSGGGNGRGFQASEVPCPPGFGGDHRAQPRRDAGGVGVATIERPQGQQPARPAEAATERADPLGEFTWLPCADGKARRVGAGILPLAHGIPGRVGQIRAYGNAIVPQVAAEFVRAFMEA